MELTQIAAKMVQTVDVSLEQKKEQFERYSLEKKHQDAFRIRREAMEQVNIMENFLLDIAFDGPDKMEKADYDVYAEKLHIRWKAVLEWHVPA